MSEPTTFSRSTSSACAPATATNATSGKNFDRIDKFIGWRRLGNKDREKVMDNIANHENWKSCFSEIGPGLLLFARQWTRSASDAEDIVQELSSRFCRENNGSETEHSFSQLCLRSLSTLFVGTNAAPQPRLLV